MPRSTDALALAAMAALALHSSFVGGIRMAAPGPGAEGRDSNSEAAEVAEAKASQTLAPVKNALWWADSDTESESDASEDIYDPRPMYVFMTELSKLRNSLLDKRPFAEHIGAIQEVMTTLADMPYGAHEFEKACDDLIDLREAFLGTQPKGSVAIYRTWLSLCDGGVWPASVPRRYRYDTSLESVSELHLEEE